MDDFELPTAFSRDSDEGAFVEKHRRFFEVWPRLETIIRSILSEPFPTGEPTVIALITRRCLDDFREVVLLAANGYGPGSTAHLRGMFERVVTAKHLSEHPEEIERFLDWDKVQRLKIATRYKEAFPLSQDRQVAFDLLRAEVDELKPKFMARCTCKKSCDVERLHHSWTPTDFVSMAKMSGPDGMVVPGYDLPTRQAHSTAFSIVLGLDLVEGNDGATLKVNVAEVEAEADRSFQFGHLFLLNILATHVDFFQLENQRDNLREAFASYKTVWLETGQ